MGATWSTTKMHLEVKALFKKVLLVPRLVDRYWLAGYVRFLIVCTMCNSNVHIFLAG